MHDADCGRFLQQVLCRDLVFTYYVTRMQQGFVGKLK
jgi:hypothetical protein